MGGSHRRGSRGEVTRVWQNPQEGLYNIEFWGLQLALAVIPQAARQMPWVQVFSWELLETLEFALRQRHCITFILILSIASYPFIIARSHPFILCQKTRVPGRGSHWAQGRPIYVSEA